MKKNDDALQNDKQTVLRLERAIDIMAVQLVHAKLYPTADDAKVAAIVAEIVDFLDAHCPEPKISDRVDAMPPSQLWITILYKAKHWRSARPVWLMLQGWSLEKSSHRRQDFERLIEFMVPANGIALSDDSGKVLHRYSRATWLTQDFQKVQLPDFELGARPPLH